MPMPVQAVPAKAKPIQPAAQQFVAAIPVKKAEIAPAPVEDEPEEIENDFEEESINDEMEASK